MNGFHLQSEHMVETALFNVQRAITPKAGKPELQSMYSACEKISEGISYAVDTNDGGIDRHSMFRTV